MKINKETSTNVFYLFLVCPSLMSIETDIPSLRKEVRKKELTKNLDDFSLQELNKLLAKQTDILCSKVVKSLPDKGEKLKKNVQEIQDRIAKLQKVLQDNSSSTKPTTLPSNSISSSTSNVFDSQLQDPLEEFYGKETIDEITKSMNNLTEDSEIDWLQRKMQFLSVKGKQLFICKVTENRNTHSIYAGKNKVFVKGNRSLQKANNSHSLIQLSLKESLTLNKSIKFENEDSLIRDAENMNKQEEEGHNDEGFDENDNEE